MTSGGALEEQELHCLLAVVSDLPEDVRRRVCTSLGRLPEKHLRELEQAGVRRYHHNLETSRAYYPRICSTQLWDQRRDTVLRAQATGLSVCAGGLFGLGESWEDRMDFAFSLRELGVRHVPCASSPCSGTSCPKPACASAAGGPRPCGSASVICSGPGPML